VVVDELGGSGTGTERSKEGSGVLHVL
jgi:hypothetical protein